MVSVSVKYKILEMTDDKDNRTVCAVPSNWMYSSTEVQWPCAKAGIRRMIVNKTEPFTIAKRWRNYKCRILKDDISEYNDAIKFEKEYAEMSDITEGEESEYPLSPFCPGKYNLGSKNTNSTEETIFPGSSGSIGTTPETTAPTDRCIRKKLFSPGMKPAESGIEQWMAEFKKKSKEDRELFIAENLYYIRKDVKVIRSAMKQSLNSTVNTPVAPSQTLRIKHLPINSLDEAEVFTRKLQLDKEYQTQIVAFLLSKKGSDVSDTVRKMCNTLMTDEFMKLFSWIGKKGKQAFSKSPLAEIIIGVCHKLYDRAPGFILPDDDIFKPLRSHIGHANDRIEKLKIKQLTAIADQEPTATTSLAFLFQ